MNKKSLKKARCRMQNEAARQMLTTGIISDPEINGGKPTIEGTRVPVKIVLVDIAHGMSIPEISEEYDLTEQQIKDTLTYAAALVP